MKAGDRIELLSMYGDLDAIEPGTQGTVQAIHDHDSWSQVEVDWDNGRSLMLCTPKDVIRVLKGDLK